MWDEITYPSQNKKLPGATRLQAWVARKANISSLSPSFDAMEATLRVGNTLRCCRPEVTIPSSQAIWGSQRGVRTAFKTKDNNRFHCLKSGPLKGPVWLGTASRNEECGGQVAHWATRFPKRLLCLVDVDMIYQMQIYIHVIIIYILFS